jgi:osmotically-inducible protein OsmY
MATATALQSETRNDEEIQRDVLAELKWDARVRPNEIGVAVKNGVVMLTGWVDSYIKKWAAEEAAHRVRGVKAVANDIEVRLSSADERTDTDIAAAAVRMLECTAFVPKIDVTVSNGWVTLKGEVEWQYQKEEAERAVRRLTGVTGVSRRLRFCSSLKARSGLILESGLIRQLLLAKPGKFSMIRILSSRLSRRVHQRTMELDSAIAAPLCARAQAPTRRMEIAERKRAQDITRALLSADRLKNSVQNRLGNS